MRWAERARPRANGRRDVAAGLAITASRFENRNTATAETNGVIRTFVLKRIKTKQNKKKKLKIKYVHARTAAFRSGVPATINVGRTVRRGEGKRAAAAAAAAAATACRPSRPLFSSSVIVVAVAVAVAAAVISRNLFRLARGFFPLCFRLRHRTPAVFRFGRPPSERPRKPVRVSFDLLRSGRVDDDNDHNDITSATVARVPSSGFSATVPSPLSVSVFVPRTELPARSTHDERPEPYRVRSCCGARPEVFR